MMVISFLFWGPVVVLGPHGDSLFVDHLPHGCSAVLIQFCCKSEMYFLMMYRTDSEVRFSHSVLQFLCQWPSNVAMGRGV